MKLYANLVRGVAETLFEIFQNERYADKALRYTLKANRKWGARDRKFVAESVYEIVRWYRLYHEVRTQEPKSVSDWYQMFAVYWLIKGGELPDWNEFRSLNPQTLLGRYEKLKASEKLTIKESIPDWIDALCQKELPKDWPTIMAALNKRAPIVLRTNTLKITRKELQSVLEKEDIPTYPFGETALILKKRVNVFQTEAFKKGYFEVQDAASQEVCAFAEIGPGMRVVDACAGAGGKTLHLAALMQNKGQLIATDTMEWKLKELKLRARRAGVSNVQIRTIDKSSVYKRLYNTADRVLIDAPCSGLGVLRRNPDSKWKLDEAFIERIKKTQSEILDRYSKIAKEDGIMTYVTCSILPSENQDQIQAFLKRNDQFELIEEKTLWPQDFGFDGFYMAKLRKLKNSVNKDKPKKKGVKTETKKADQTESKTAIPKEPRITRREPIETKPTKTKDHE